MASMALTSSLTLPPRSFPSFRSRAPSKSAHFLPSLKIPNPISISHSQFTNKSFPISLSPLPNKSSNYNNKKLFTVKATASGAAPSAKPPAPAPWQGAAIKPLLASIATGIILWFVPVPAGVTRNAWQLLTIFLATIVGIITQPLHASLSKKQLQSVLQTSSSEMKPQANDIVHERRSANYKPNIWNYDYLQSLSSIYDGQEYERRVQKLKEDVRIIFANAVDSVATFELIDSVNKLGLASHFDMEIKEALDTIASTKKKISSPEEDLYTTALCFRLFRQHGYEVSQDMFRGFMDEKTGLFRENTHVNIKEMLELLEASHLGFEGENILDVARDFSTATLKESVSSLDSDLAKQVVHVLELPSQRRVQWFDVKWHIKSYEKDIHTNSSLLELAKLHFNIVQAILQKDLRESSRWWRNLGLTENLSFARDRLAESFMCSVGLAFEPEYTCLRKWLTRVVVLILIIDDVYDVYGTLEELKHFTNAVDRWDVSETQQLPECMKTCFLALYNTTNEIANEIQEKKGAWNQVLPHLKKGWTDFCNALFVEAKWYNMGYTPSLQEYLSNGWISSTGPLLLVHEFFSMGHEVTNGMEDFLEKNQEIVYNISTIIRLCNDLGTSVAERARGDVPSSILCYMREADVSEEIAQKHIEDMINKSWKKINGQCFNQLPMLQSFVNIATNNARGAHSLYQYGDGFGVQDRDTRKNIVSLLVEPLVL